MQGRLFRDDNPPMRRVTKVIVSRSDDIVTVEVHDKDIRHDYTLKSYGVGDLFAPVHKREVVFDKAGDVLAYKEPTPIHRITPALAYALGEVGFTLAMNASVESDGTVTVEKSAGGLGE